MSGETNTGEQTPQGADGGSAEKRTANVKEPVNKVAQTEDFVEGESTTMTFAEAIAPLEGETLAPDEETYLPLEAYEGARFVPNTDATRPVKPFNAPSKGAIIRLMRTGSNESNGCFARAVEVSAAFKVNLNKYPTHTQVNLKLANGKMLTGYISLGKSRKGVYFPKNLAEAAVALPTIGKLLPVKATMLAIG